jgi:hypothetical protein
MGQAADRGIVQRGSERPRAGWLSGRRESDRAAPRVSRDQLVAMTPPLIRQTLPMVPWNIYKLHDLDLPVQPVAVDDLAWLFDLPLWQDNGTRFQVSPPTSAPTQLGSPTTCAE